jgi:hypothetical protein
MPRQPAAAGPAHAVPPVTVAARLPQASASLAEVAYTYIGATALVAMGPVTRRRYHFDQPGATLAVDGRDAPAFAAIPHLRRGRPAA